MYQKHLVLLLIFSTVLCSISCRKDFETIASNGKLSFSKDTIFLDTVFSQISTKTYTLKVYNRTNNDIAIPSIRLEKNDSKYRLNVDGNSGKIFSNIPVLKKDSLFIFIETTVSSAETNDGPLYTDRILFDDGVHQQKVNLVTLVEDVIFLGNSTSNSFDINTNTFTNTKPYVIYGNAVVPENQQLTIDPGTKVYFHKNASLTISKNASLNINGTLANPVNFRGDQLSYTYNEIPGQWKGIVCYKDAQAININYLNIQNPTIGIDCNETNTPINCKNTTIYNASENGISAINSTFKGENIVIGQTGKSCLNLKGGNYEFNHCTFANFWNKGFRTKEAIILSNYKTDENAIETPIPLTNANFNNCIISGSKNDELFLDKLESESVFNFKLSNCLLKKPTGLSGLNNTNDIIYYENNVINGKEDFKDTNKNDLRIGLENEGINKGKPTVSNQVPQDIIGTNRTTSDIGAYQSIDFNAL